MTEILDRALQYGARGWRVLRLYPLRNGVCTCKKGMKCGTSAGKHPIGKTGRWHLDAATVNPALIGKHFRGNNPPNLGIVTGQASGVCVVDIDGTEGWATLETLMAVHGKLPQTAWATTGRERGAHLYFAVEGPTPMNDGAGLDIRGDGGLVVAPPSPHYSGRSYAWGEELPLAVIPPWLVQWFEHRDPSSRRAAPAGARAAGSTPQGRVGSLADRALGVLYEGSAEADSIEDIVDALAAIPNNDMGWNTYTNYGMATWVASAGSEVGREAFRAFARKAPKFNKKGDGDAEVDRLWEHYPTSPPSRLGFGWLYKRACEADPEWLPRSRQKVAVIPLNEPPAEEAATPQEEIDEDVTVGTALLQPEANGHHAIPNIFPQIAKAEPSNPLIELNKRCAVIGDIGGKCLVMSWVPSKIDGSVKVPSFQTFKSFSERYANQYISVKVEKKGEMVDEPKQVGPYWLKWTKRRSFEGIDLMPGGEEVLPGGVLNLWTGFGVAPAEPGEDGWPLMRQHITEVLASGDRDAAAYIAKFAAWAVQHPGERAEVALIFRGGKGTGKGTFAHAMRRLFGQHGLHVSNSKHLVGSFNAHLRSCLLLFADEAFWAGDKQGESVLKALITEPVLMIEQKGVDAVQWRNAVHLIMAANAEWIVPASHDERRYAVFDVSDCRQGDEEYFDALHREIRGGGLAAMLRDLLEVDLKGWHPRHVLRTEALRQQKIRSMDPRWEWWEEVLQMGIVPRHEMGQPAAAQASAIFEHFRESAGHWRGTNPTVLGRFLRAVGSTSRHTRTGTMWDFSDLTEARAAFEKEWGKWVWREEVKNWQDRAKIGPNPSTPSQSVTA